jgi:carbon-monoxide dehydrogenase medium subunit
MPAADGAIAGLALGAEARIVGADGERWEGVEGLFAGPGVSRVDPTREVLTHLRFRTPSERTGTAWRRVGRRAALVLPILNCAVRVELEGGPGVGGEDGRASRIADAAIALGPVAPRPLRAREAEVYLVGRAAEAGVLREASDIARSEADPRTSVMRASREYRLAILPELVMGALTTAVERAGG